MVKIGIVGVGGIANGVHITQLLEVADCRITAICDTNPNTLKKTGDRLNLPENCRFTDYKALIDCKNVDAVEVCTPNYLHIPIAEYAAKAGKPINVEKPMGMSAEECESLESIVNNGSITNMVCFSYRFMPAVRYAKTIIDKGLLGDIVGVNVEYKKSSAFWQGRLLEWRFVKKYAGTGVLGDLGVHLIDMAQLLVGDFKKISGITGIIVKHRPKIKNGELYPVETDDYCNFVATLQDRRSGSEVGATFSVTRCAIGHSNTIRYEIFGTEGVIAFNLNSPNELSVCIGEIDKFAQGGMHTIKVPQSAYGVSQEQAFVDAVNGKLCDLFPTVSDGVKCQKILDAIVKSAESGQTVYL